MLGSYDKPIPVNNQQSTISNQQSVISNQQSAINNQQSTISNQIPFQGWNIWLHITPYLNHWFTKIKRRFLDRKPLVFKNKTAVFGQETTGLQKLNGGFWIENRWITYVELPNYILENVSRQGYRTVRASQGIGDEKGHVNFAARKRRLQKLGGSLTPKGLCQK